MRTKRKTFRKMVGDGVTRRPMALMNYRITWHFNQLGVRINCRRCLDLPIYFKCHINGTLDSFIAAHVIQDARGNGRDWRIFGGHIIWCHIQSATGDVIGRYVKIDLTVIGHFPFERANHKRYLERGLFMGVLLFSSIYSTRPAIWMTNRRVPELFRVARVDGINYSPRRCRIKAKYHKVD